jgi:tetratricopeptide (TPR) repeat protein
MTAAAWACLVSLLAAQSPTPSNASDWKALGASQVAVNDLQGAAVSLGKACALAPAEGDSCYLHGRTLDSLGRYEETREPFDRSLREAAPEDLAKVHRAMALNFEALILPEDAERHFRDVVRYYRASARVVEDPRVGYGAFLIRRGRALEAAAVIEQIAIAFGRRLQLPDQIRKLLNVPAIDVAQDPLAVQTVRAWRPAVGMCVVTRA